MAIASRLWQSLAGLLSLYFIVTFFTPKIQGYYQTFVSLVALQWFFELGIIVAVVSAASHEWAGLRIGPGRTIEGKPENVSRLATLARFVVVWFAGAALLLFLVGGAVGFVVLSRQGGAEIWFRPWVATIGVAAALLWCQGIVAVVEGCNQIFEVASYRLVQSVVGSLCLWAAVSSGLGIWSLAVMTAANLLCAISFLTLAYRRFLLALLLSRIASTFDWRRDIWPMQWPLALQGVTGYFMFSLFVPVIYSYHGVVEAGRMGISVQVVMALLSVATACLSVQAPRLGTMYARGEIEHFEIIWATLSAISLTVVIAGVATVSGLLFWASANHFAPAARFLDPPAFLLLLLWAVAIQLVQCAATYWRAQKREAVGGWGVLPGLVTGSCVWLFGRGMGSVGAATAALAATLCVSVPLGAIFFAKSRALSLERRRAIVDAPA